MVGQAFLPADPSVRAREIDASPLRGSIWWSTSELFEGYCSTLFPGKQHRAERGTHPGQPERCRNGHADSYQSRMNLARMLDHEVLGPLDPHCAEPGCLDKPALLELPHHARIVTGSVNHYL